MNIYEKIAAIMSDVQYLAKDDRVQFNQTDYKALSEEKVTSILRAEMLKHKLVVFPVQQTSSRQGNISHVDVVYRIVNVESPDEFIEVASCGDGADTQDKGSGKAMTYAFKYMWLRTFALPTGEDSDKIANAQIEADVAANKADKPILCEDCGQPINGTKKRDGTLLYPEDIAAGTKSRYGKVLCVGCGKKARKAKDAQPDQTAKMEV